MKHKTKNFLDVKLCKHCEGDLAIRNPSGDCDHLYFPENCDTCKALRLKDDDAPQPKQIRKQVKNRSRIKERDKEKNYNGESSPYREYLERLGDPNQDHDSNEPAEANPDVLDEKDGLWYIKRDIDEELLAKVLEATKELTHRQKQVLQMVGYEGKTIANVAAILNISRGNVSDLLNRARIIIKKAIRTKHS